MVEIVENLMWLESIMIISVYPHLINEGKCCILVLLDEITHSKHSVRRKTMKTELTQKQIEEALEAQRKYQKLQAINKRSWQRRNAWTKLMLEKAEEAKIVVSDAEVDAWMVKHPSKK